MLFTVSLRPGAAIPIFRVLTIPVVWCTITPFRFRFGFCLRTSTQMVTAEMRWCGAALASMISSQFRLDLRRSDRRSKVCNRIGPALLLNPRNPWQPVIERKKYIDVSRSLSILSSPPSTALSFFEEELHSFSCLQSFIRYRRFQSLGVTDNSNCYSCTTSPTP